MAAAMYSVAWKTRRASIIGLVSSLLSVVLLALFPHSYAIASLDQHWDTPMTRLLPAFLGMLLGAGIYSVAPAMEALGGRRLRVARTGIVVILSALQAAVLLISVPLVNTLWSAGITSGDVQLYMASLVFWQALVVLSVGLAGARWGWLLPGALFMLHIGFGFQENAQPRIWNTIMGFNPWTLGMSALLVVAAVVVLLFGPIWRGVKSASKERTGALVG